MLRILPSIIYIWSMLCFAQEMPQWVHSPVEFCSSKYLCAVGEGSGKLVAEASARNELAKIFKVEIVASSQFGLTEESTKSSEGALVGQVDSTQSTFLKESVDEVLEGLEIVETYMSDDGFYALARLSKKNASNRFTQQMNSLDDEIKVLMEQNKRSSFFKAYKIFKTREVINQRYHILNERFYNGFWSKKSILSKLEEKKEQSVLVHLSNKNMPKEWEFLVLEGLLNLGYRVRTDKPSKYQFKIKTRFDKSQQHLKVKGFEKWKFEVNLLSSTKKKEKIGQVRLEFIQTGRSYEQCLSGAFEQFKKTLEDRLGELTLD
ncbi:MAG: LPP20 family lipoprotein [Bacteriovoracaceae bacterium]